MKTLCLEIAKLLHNFTPKSYTAAFLLFILVAPWGRTYYVDDMHTTLTSGQNWICDSLSGARHIHTYIHAYVHTNVRTHTHAHTSIESRTHGAEQLTGGLGTTASSYPGSSSSIFPCFDIVYFHAATTVIETAAAQLELPLHSVAHERQQARQTDSQPVSQPASLQRW